MEGYCFKCKEKREMVEPQAEWTKSGSAGTRGKCPVCEGTIYKMGRTPAHEDLPKPIIAPRPKKKKTAAKKSATKKKKPGRKKKPAPRRSGKLVIVESPAKAKTIGKYLGRGYKVRSSVGHVRDLLKSRMSVDVENNFTPEYRVPNDKRKLVKELKADAAKAKEIYLATDLDREGEAIAWHVLESAEMEPERTQRVVFNQITKTAVIEAFDHPREIDMDQVNAQQARRILDRLVGYTLSPLLWRKVRGRLSAGRVQSVAVRLVVEREREIDNFTPVEYWSMEANLGQEKTRAVEKRPLFTAKFHKFNNEKPVLNSAEDVQPHLDTLEKATWTMGKVRRGTRKRRPAAPFTTSTLQQEASRKLKFGTSKTMRVAQQLYEGIDIGEKDAVGLITYMRTDSVTVAKEAKEEARAYIKTTFGDDYVPAKSPVYKTKSKGAQEAHEAVRPTGAARSPKAMKPFLKRDQYRLYKLIWDRFMASEMENAVYDTISADIWAGDVDVDVKKRPYLFRVTGSSIRFLGFLRLYEETRPEDKPEDGNKQLPSDFTEGEGIDMMKLLPEQHFTQPLPRFSDARLVREMEENGIGRPSTYAAIVSTIQNRGYVVKENGRLYPTETGEVVNDLLVEYFADILSPDFTARMEDNLDKIAEGADWVPVIRDFYEKFAVDVAKADEALPKGVLKVEPEPVGRDCPDCEHPLLYRVGRYGRFVGCSNFPACRYTEQILIKIGISCPKDGGDLVQKKTRRGRTFYGCANYPDCDWTSWKRPLTQPCDSCGGLLVQSNKTLAECTVCAKKQPLPEQIETENS